MKKVAAIIKHPGRDWEGDVRIDIMEVPDDVDVDKVRQQIQCEMLGPFEVLFITDKINFSRVLKPKEIIADGESHV